MAPDASSVHSAWMHSEGHRTNLLNREVDRVGIAVITRGGYVYAVADYARGVEAMGPEQVERAVADLVQMSGVQARAGTEDARRACTMDRGLPRGLTGGDPMFVMRWQGADVEHLPQPLVDRLGGGQYRKAAVGSCAARGADGGFTTYRVAVLLY